MNECGFQPTMKPDAERLAERGQKIEALAARGGSTLRPTNAIAFGLLSCMHMQ